MIYQRSTNDSYHMWADLVGDNSYQFEHLLPYFQKSICFTPPNMDARYVNSTPLYDLSVMGNCSGPLSVTYSNYAYQFASWATIGLQEMGIFPINGFESGSLLGQSYVMSTIDAKKMTRDSSETSFLREALGLPNYTVYPMTMAKKVTFGPGNTATGVDVDTLGARYHLAATKEVIVSAGVFGSPQLLMVSGIGPASVLNSLGISVLADRPGVGQNLQDHVYYGPAYRVKGTTISSITDPGYAAEATRQYQQSTAGVLTNPGNDVLGWEKLPEPLRSTLSPNARNTLDEYPADWPEVEYLAISAYLGYQNQSGGNDPKDGSQYATMGAALIAPRSRGNVSIKSADNAIPPVINPNYFSDPVDVEVAIASYKRIREFWTSPNMTDFRADNEEAFPGLNLSSDADIERVIKQSFLMIFHAACTCSMGQQDDAMAVVDSQARVYGVAGLRVVDASIFPVLTPGHPMATVCKSSIVSFFPT